MKEANQTTPVERLKYSKPLKLFISKYETKKAEEIDWIEFCANVCKAGCYKYGLNLLICLLDNGLYKGKYADFLYPLLPVFKRLVKQYPTSYQTIFCGDDIRYLIICEGRKRTRIHYYFRIVRTDNRDIIRLLAASLVCKAHFAKIKHPVCESFGESFGEYENSIHDISDFSEYTLFQQIEFYKKRFNNEPVLLSAGISLVLNFYRWIVISHPELDFFEGSFRMTERLLFSSGLPEILKADYFFTTINPANIPYGHERVCLIMKGFEQQSTRITKDDYVSLDLSALKCEFYRNLLLEFTITSTSASSIKWVGIAYYNVEAMQNLYVLKQDSFYPNRDIRFLSNQEAVFIRQFFDRQPVGIRTKNNKIGAVRRFIKFCEDKHAIRVDDLFFDYLVQYEEPNKNTAIAIPDEDLVKLHHYFAEKGKTDVFYQEISVVFHLLLQTEFRINQICHLELDCVRPTIKPNQYELVSISKPSHGKKIRSVISNATYDLLMDIIEKTEPIRDNCPIASLHQYIFVYTRASRRNYASVLSDNVIRPVLQKACDDLGIVRYKLSNLRDTHMTKAFEHIMRNGKSDMEMSVLSKHKYIDTTKNHYLQMELDKMLEATYGITIGTLPVQTDGKVLKNIPETLQGSENDVENGCGKCSADQCVMTSSLPCLVCKHFVTTVLHESFFVKAIENIDKLIRCTHDPHDKDDLLTIKELYFLYLKAIIEKQEENENDD